MNTALLYITLACVAVGVNLLTQDLTLRVYEGRWSIETSILVGTAIGLVVKYALDKRFIFRFQARSVAHDGHTFVLYATVGLVTTLVFWGFEGAFHWWFGGVATMRYLGGAIGLGLGYWAKYHLDKRFVFRDAAA